jgi:hypothetical protein
MWTTMMSAVATAPLLNRFVEPEEVLLVASAWLLAAGLVATTGTRRPAAGPVAAGVGSRS